MSTQLLFWPALCGAVAAFVWSAEILAQLQRQAEFAPHPLLAENDSRRLQERVANRRRQAQSASGLFASACLALGFLFSTSGFAFAADGADIDLDPAPTAEAPAAESPVIEASAVETSAPAENVATPVASGAAAERSELAPRAGSVEIPPGRPDWVESDPIRKGDIHVTAVCSDPHTDERSAQAALNQKLTEAVAEYVNWNLGSKLASTFVVYDVDYIKSHLVQDRYRETITVSLGPMHQMHARLEFNPQFRADMERRWKQVVSGTRLVQLGVIAAGILGLLATVWSYFRIDTATRGYYTSRLQFGAAAVILALAVAGVAISRYLAWL